MTVKLLFDDDWLRTQLSEPDLDDFACPHGVLAGVCWSCVREDNLKGMTMTTKVKVELVQEHMPVCVEVLRSDGTVQHFAVLMEKGNATEDYVHSGQTIRVREMTTQEIHEARNLSKP